MVTFVEIHENYKRCCRPFGNLALKQISIFSIFIVTDIDECSMDPGQCDVNADCTNSAGSYSCTCKQGFTGNGTTCEGILECFFHVTIFQTWSSSYMAI